MSNSGEPGFCFVVYRGNCIPWELFRIPSLGPGKGETQTTFPSRLEGFFPRLTGEVYLRDYQTTYVTIGTSLGVLPLLVTIP